MKLGFIALLIAVITAVTTIIVLLLTDANILRAPIARYLGGRLDRPVAINGDLRVRLFNDPRLEINGLTLGNARWGSRPTMVQVERAVIRFQLLKLLQGRIVLPEVELTKPDVLLERDADGTPNWQFGKRPASSTGQREPPEIHTLSIRDGRVQFRDPTTGSDVVLQLQSDLAAAGADSRIGFVGSGRVRDGELDLEGHAASLLDLNREGQPYQVEVRARAGDTKAMFDGTVVPLKLETIDGRLELSGKDLSKLYPLVPVALPWTSSYRVAGHFLREGRKFTLRDLTGRVGGSDVQGSVSLDVTRERPFLTADLTSRRLDYKDLAGFLGAPPPAQGERRPSDQEREVAVRQATGKVLPTKPYDVTRLRGFDADVHFKARSIISRGLPLDNMVADLKLKDGTLVLSPLDFGVAGGHVTSQVTLDARKDLIQTKARATVANLEAKALLPALKRSSGSAGKVGGRAELSASGNSMAAMAASANGELALIMSQGRASTLSLVLVNLDLANAAKYLLYGDPNAPVHCGVITGRVQDGVLAPQTFVVDSSEEKITGEGTIDFKDERYNLRLAADSKRTSLVALRGPIRVGGTFKQPEVRPEVGPLAARVGAAVALGIVATPLAALIPLVDPGDAKDANCRALIEQAGKEASERSGEQAPASSGSSGEQTQPTTRPSAEQAPARSAPASAGRN